MRLIMMKKTIVITILLFILYNCQSSKDKYFIKEGYGSGNIALQTKFKNSPKSIDGISVLINRDSLIYAIDFTSKLFYTSDNLRVGTNYETILNLRGMYDKSKPINKPKFLNHKKKKFPFSMRYDRIIFFLDEQGVVEKIRIY